MPYRRSVRRAEYVYGWRCEAEYIIVSVWQDRNFLWKNMRLIRKRTVRIRRSNCIRISEAGEDSSLLSMSIFYKIMGKDLGRVRYDEDAALYPGADYPALKGEQGSSEVIVVEQDSSTERSILEAGTIGRKIPAVKGKTDGSRIKKAESYEDRDIRIWSSFCEVPEEMPM